MSYLLFVVCLVLIGFLVKRIRKLEAAVIELSLSRDLHFEIIGNHTKIAEIDNEYRQSAAELLVDHDNRLKRLETARAEASDLFSLN